MTALAQATERGAGRSGEDHTLGRVWLWRAAWLAIVSIGLFLRCSQPRVYILDSPFDDSLMVQMAKGFLNGHWSTSWQATGLATLVKPVGFPLLLAGAHFLPWSPIVSGYLLFLVGVGLIANSWWRITRSHGQTTLIVAMLALNPIFFASDNQRIYRDIFTNDVATLAIGLTSCLGVTLLQAARAGDPPMPRRLWWLARVLMLSVVLGGLSGLILVTKPTWQWLPFAVLAPLALPCVLLIRRSGPSLRSIGTVAMTILIPIASALGVVQVVKTMNKRTYGVALVEDFSSGGLARAWAAWASIEAGPPRQYFPITKEMRLAAYRVSPAAAELRSYLESPNDIWKKETCLSSLHVCDESGPLFEWDMQSAAMSTGRIHSAVDFQEFFNRLANQIEAACRRGTLTCDSSPVLATGLPPLDHIPLSGIASATAEGFLTIVWNHVSVTPPALAAPTAAEYQLWASVVPAMSSQSDVSQSAPTTALRMVLEGIDEADGVTNVILILVILLGMLMILTRVRRQAASDASLHATVMASVFFVSLLIGVGTLAVFTAGQSPGYVVPLYWADFATPAQLFLVFGSIASLTLLRKRAASG
jgi:hypothetical protein